MNWLGNKTHDTRQAPSQFQEVFLPLKIYPVNDKLQSMNVAKGFKGNLHVGIEYATIPDRVSYDGTVTDACAIQLVHSERR